MKAEMKHTPGPWDIKWYICRDGETEHWRVPITIGPASVDHNHWAGNHIDVSEADARLIKAAPDMLAALQFLSSLHPRRCILAEVVLARSVIAMVMGEQT